MRTSYSTILFQGFGIRVTPQVTSCIVQYRASDGKRPRETLGGSRRWPALTVAEARDLARERLGKIMGIAAHGTSVPLRLAMRRWYERQVLLNEWRPRYAVRVDALIHAYVEGGHGPRLQLSPTAIAAIDALGAKPVGAGDARGRHERRARGSAPANKIDSREN